MLRNVIVALALLVSVAGAGDLEILEKMNANNPGGSGPLPEIGLDAHCPALECGWPVSPYPCSGFDLDMDPEAGIQFFQVAARPDKCGDVVFLTLGPDLEFDALNWSLETNTLSDGTAIIQGVRTSPLYSSVRHIVRVVTYAPAPNELRGFAVRDECWQGLAFTHFAGTWSAAGGGGAWSSYCGEHVIGTASCECAGEKPVPAAPGTWSRVKAMFQ